MSAGDQVRDFLDVTVAARMISAIIGQRAVVGIINCSSGVPRTVLEVVDSIVAERERDIELDVGVHPYPRGEPMRAWGDTAKQRAALAGSHMRIGREGAV
jgi:dTDP-6-deoxy-L-talose 4-dehydrogenase (NAD+)